MLAVIRHARQVCGSGARALALQAVVVPGLGDSISQGTVVSLEKRIGEAVAADDIIAILETDKVTVDVRAGLAGVMASYAVAPGDDVDVNAVLGQIDSDGTPAAMPTPPTPAQPEAVAKPSPAPAEATQSLSPAAPVSASSYHSSGMARVPRIQFRHGRANKAAAAAAATTSVPNAPVASVSPVEGSDAGLEFAPSKATLAADELPIMYGRPPLSQREMDAIMAGGEDLD